MQLPEFFDAVPPLVLRDPLAAFLGAAEDGLIEYRYADAVKLAGHSCPTVAGAWLMTRCALAALYGGAVPERGGLKVEFRDAQDSGVTGVIANVAGLLTGAAGDGGFKGLGGRFNRRGLMAFGVPMEGEIRFTRVDTAAAVETAYRPQLVPPQPETGMLLQKIQAGSASAEERRTFGHLWQERVKHLLLGQAGTPEWVTVSRKP